MRVTGVILVAMHFLAASASDATADLDAWYDGQVQVQLRVLGGEGSVFPAGSDVAFEFEATESAYHMVVGIDAQGGVQLLFPRFWEDDGWVRRGSIQQVHPRDFAAGRNPWRGEGVVYVEVIASPTPFDWQRVGLRRAGNSCRWWRSSRPLVIAGDPFDALNELHRRLFPRWDHALFVVDATWFFQGQRCDVPRYEHTVAGTVVVSSHLPLRSNRLRVRWEWQFGPWCARPVYRHASYADREYRRLPSTRHRSIAVRHLPRQRQAVRVDADPRVLRKQVIRSHVRNAPRQADERVVVRQHPVPKRNEANRRKLK